MEVLQYEPKMSSELTGIYNDVTCNVPHCYRVSVDDFTHALGTVVGEGQQHDRLNSEAAFVAREGQSTLGFVHVAVEQPENADKTERGIIRFLCYERGRREAGQALLTTAEEYLRQRNQNRIIAFPQDYRYRFYHFANAFLSDRMDPIQALLGFNGYERVAGEVYLDWPNYNVTPKPADIVADISLQWIDGNGTRPGLVVRAHQNEKEIGVCVCVSGGEYSRADDAQDWLFTNWLGISDAMQGKGLGRYLLHRALEEMQTIGYRHAAISTSWRNFRAFLFYSNHGYHVVDWTYGFSLNISAQSRK